MRNRFDEQLQELNVALIEMGALCENVIEGASEALLEGNMETAKKVIEIDSSIDQKERDIETQCMKLLLQQQPVARDLRQISAALKMITDMERIGDQAADIAEIIMVADIAGSVNKVRIGDMAKATIHMVSNSIEAFVKKDLKLARDVIDYDDVVDDLFLQVRTELISMIREETDLEQCAMDLLMIAKYFERLGDHATNIAEWVEYSITGTHRSAELTD